MLDILGFIDCSSIGGLPGLFLAALAVECRSMTPFFVIAPSSTSWSGGDYGADGRPAFLVAPIQSMYSEGSQIAFYHPVYRINVTSFPQFILGYEGMPRRYPV